MKVLIIKTSSLGDILQCLFIAGYLKKRFNASIDWLVEERFQEVCKAAPDIENVICVDSKKILKAGIKSILETVGRFKKLRYDCVIDLQGNIKSGLFMMPIRAKQKIGFTLSSAAEWPNIFFTNQRYYINPKGPIQLQYLSLVQQHFRDSASYYIPKIELALSSLDRERLNELSGHFIVPYNTIMVCLGSNWENKRLQKSQITSILKWLEGKVHPHFLFIYSNEKEKKEALELQSQFVNSNSVGDLSIPLWQYIMLKCRGVLSMDSAALHLAALCKVKSFVFFGPSNSLVYNPKEEQHRAVQGSCPYHQTFDKRCKKLRTCATGACLKKLELDRVYESLRLWLSPL